MRVCKKIVSRIKHNSIYAQESGAEISRIKDLLQKIKFEVKIKFIRGNIDQPEQENIEPLKTLLRECDEKPKKHG